MTPAVAIIAYVPPPTFGNPKAFLDNMRACPSKNRTILFSNHDWEGMDAKISDPEIAKQRPNPRAPGSPVAVNNLVFLVALKIAIANKLDCFLYIEADSRVACKHWDEPVFDEFLDRGCVIGGSAVLWSVSNQGYEAYGMFRDFLDRHPIKKYPPIGIYGARGAAEFVPACLYTNGSLSILNTKLMEEFFPVGTNQQVEMARTMPAYDLAIGHRMWNKFGVKSYSQIAHLKSSWSGCGNLMTTEEQRLKWLAEKRVFATHQIKGAI